MASAIGWIDRLMPPVVTGSVVAVIGLNLAPIAVKGISGSALDTWVGLATIVAVGLVAVRAPGLARRLPVLLGGIAGYLLYASARTASGLGKPIDFARRRRGRPGSACRGCQSPVWNAQAIGADRAGGDRAGRREPRPHQGRRGDDRPQPRPVPRPRVRRRRPRDDRRGRGRRHGRHDVRRKHRRHGGDEDLLDAALRRRRAVRDRARLLAEVRRADHDDSRRRCWAGCRSSCSA